MHPAMAPSLALVASPPLSSSSAHTLRQYRALTPAHGTSADPCPHQHLPPPHALSLRLPSHCQTLLPPFHHHPPFPLLAATPLSAHALCVLTCATRHAPPPPAMSYVPPLIRARHTSFPRRLFDPPPSLLNPPLSLPPLLAHPPSPLASLFSRIPHSLALCTSPSVPPLCAAPLCRPSVPPLCAAHRATSGGIQAEPSLAIPPHAPSSLPSPHMPPPPCHPPTCPLLPAIPPHAHSSLPFNLRSIFFPALFLPLPATTHPFSPVFPPLPSPQHHARPPPPARAAAAPPRSWPPRRTHSRAPLACQAHGAQQPCPQWPPLHSRAPGNPALPARTRMYGVEGRVPRVIVGRVPIISSPLVSIQTPAMPIEPPTCAASCTIPTAPAGAVRGVQGQRHLQHVPGRGFCVQSCQRWAALPRTGLQPPLRPTLLRQVPRGGERERWWGERRGGRECMEGMKKRVKAQGGGRGGWQWWWMGMGGAAHPPAHGCCRLASRDGCAHVRAEMSVLMCEQRWVCSCARRDGCAHVRAEMGVLMCAQRWVCSCARRDGCAHVRAEMGVLMCAQRWVCSCARRDGCAHVRAEMGVLMCALSPCFPPSTLSLRLPVTHLLCTHHPRQPHTIHTTLTTLTPPTPHSQVTLTHTLTVPLPVPCHGWVGCGAGRLANKWRYCVACNGARVCGTCEGRRTVDA
ncbi:unnamed protein product [Closterium sp. NIES-64]|nr:unnamed protein product [Closterium sp. NIES-64]